MLYGVRKVMVSGYYSSKVGIDIDPISEKKIFKVLVFKI